MGDCNKLDTQDQPEDLVRQLAAAKEQVEILRGYIKSLTVQLQRFKSGKELVRVKRENSRLQREQDNLKKECAELEDRLSSFEHPYPQNDPTYDNVIKALRPENQNWNIFVGDTSARFLDDYPIDELRDWIGRLEETLRQACSAQAQYSEKLFEQRKAHAKSKRELEDEFCLMIHNQQKEIDDLRAHSNDDTGDDWIIGNLTEDENPDSPSDDTHDEQQDDARSDGFHEEENNIPRVK